MHPRDKCKTTFMTELSCYCYKVMPFGLKNAGATYQRLMDRVPAPMIGRNVQAYVDDMVVTSHVKEQHVTDLEELFTTIAESGEVCVRGRSREVSRFLAHRVGDRSEPREVHCNLGDEKPKFSERSTTVDRVHGRPVQIRISWRRQGTPLLPMPKEEQQVLWTQECEEAFLKLKEYLASPPVLCKLQPSTPLRLYFAVTDRAISSVLVQEQDQV